MKAAVYYKNGPPEVLQYEDVADPVCGPGFVLIKVEAISIEGGDTLNRLGGPLLANPHIVGLPVRRHRRRSRRRRDGPGGGRPGRGHDDERLARRAGRRAQPGHLEDPRRRRHRGVRVRAGRVRHRARLPVRIRPPHEGETVLIQAGAGGVGVAAIQLAKRAGAHGDRHGVVARASRAVARSRPRPPGRLLEGRLGRRGPPARRRPRREPRGRLRGRLDAAEVASPASPTAAALSPSAAPGASSCRSTSACSA